MVNCRGGDPGDRGIYPLHFLTWGMAPLFPLGEIFVKECVKVQQIYKLLDGILH